ncbi:hypothetical protein ABIE13_003218 [Ottowia thiooxydans]|uniref:Uncharacterized protein n=1 Tax=Ottowia thiooxydans TaxID=219182 RepID=A0ABV2QAP8_9BURK
MHVAVIRGAGVLLLVAFEIVGSLWGVSAAISASQLSHG